MGQDRTGHIGSKPLGSNPWKRGALAVAGRGRSRVFGTGLPCPRLRGAPQVPVGGVRLLGGALAGEGAGQSRVPLLRLAVPHRFLRSPEAGGPARALVPPSATIREGFLLKRKEEPGGLATRFAFKKRYFRLSGETLSYAKGPEGQVSPLPRWPPSQSCVSAPKGRQG